MVELFKQYIADLNEEGENTTETMKYIHDLLKRSTGNTHTQMMKLYNKINSKYKFPTSVNNMSFVTSDGGKHHKKYHTRKSRNHRSKKKCSKKY
jgi:hypothetical protein